MGVLARLVPSENPFRAQNVEPRRHVVQFLELPQQARPFPRLISQSKPQSAPPLSGICHFICFVGAYYTRFYKNCAKYSADGVIPCSDCAGQRMELATNWVGIHADGHTPR